MLIKDDCLNAMAGMEANSIDALITDPPAGISFMSKDWDHHKGGRDTWITWMAQVMSECLRVLKPGAHGLVWAIPRTSHWTATALENAGFEVRDVITHLFGSGFPKSLDISKAIDKAAGAKRTEILGERHDADKLRYLQNGGYESASGWKVSEYDLNVYAPATDAAKQWQGWGTALKPASEHWILVRKPCAEKTIAANVLEWGCGGINIDASRIDPVGFTNGGNCKGNSALHMNREAGIEEARQRSEQHPQGRFPANLILDEQAAALLDEQSGILKSGARIKDYEAVGNIKAGHAGKPLQTSRCESSSGGASRFFYCAKASKRERNAGCDGLENATRGHKTNLEKLGATGSHRMANAQERAAGESIVERKGDFFNHHPTVKPQKLMQYLIKLITPPGGTVLDPFMGSGSTGVAAKALGFGFVGIEREPDYFKIAEARFEAVSCT